MQSVLCTEETLTNFFHDALKPYQFRKIEEYISIIKIPVFGLQRSNLIIWLAHRIVIELFVVTKPTCLGCIYPVYLCAIDPQSCNGASLRLILHAQKKWQVLKEYHEHLLLMNLKLQVCLQSRIPNVLAAIVGDYFYPGDAVSCLKETWKQISTEAARLNILPAVTSLYVDPFLDYWNTQYPPFYDNKTQTYVIDHEALKTKQQQFHDSERRLRKKTKKQRGGQVKTFKPVATPKIPTEIVHENRFSIFASLESTN